MSIQLTITELDTEETVAAKVACAKDQLFRQVLEQGIETAHGSRPEDDCYGPKRIHQRRKYIATRLRRADMPEVVAVQIFHWLWMYGMNEDCCGYICQALRREQT